MKAYSVSTLKRYFLLGITCCTFFSYTSLHAESEDYQLEKPINYLEAIAKQHLGSYVKDEVNEYKTEEEKKQEIEERKKRQVYEADRPDLSKRDCASILLLEIFGKNNKAAQEFIQKRLANNSVHMLPLSWETMHVVLGSPNAPAKHILNHCLRPGALDIEKIAMAIMLVTPTSNIKALEKCQDCTAVLLENPALHQRFKELYGKLQEAVPAIVSLYSRRLDPIWNISYQQALTRTFPNNNGRFTLPWLVNAYQAFQVHFMIFIMLPLLYILSLLFTIGVPFLVSSGHFSLYMYIVGTIGLWIFSVGYSFLVRMGYKMSKTYNNYIGGRIADVKTLLEVAEELSNIISSYPILEELYGDKLTHTRKLLALQHENPAYNKTVKIIRNNNFKNRSLFTSRISKVLYTLTLLEENLRMLDAVLFELGHLGVFLSIARLVENPDKNLNTFSFVKYLSEEEKPDVYIDFKKNWSIAIDPNNAVPNDIFMDGSIHNTAAITGPNACGKSIIFIRAIFESILIGQALGVMPGTGTFTPFSAIYVFKEPKDDPSIKKSLFARELDIIKMHKKVLQYYHKLNKKTITIYDEFLNSTNPLEGGALQCVLIIDTMQTFSKNVNFVSTHNPYLIELLNQLDKGIIYHVKIKRFADNTYEPLYKIGVGLTNERVGVDLYEKETGDKRLAEKARALAKLIEKSQGKVNYAKQAAATA